MNYTNNYHLPQWEKADRIMMDDFNQMCANIDSGIRDARAEAVTARSEAAEAAKLPYVTGTYLGNGDAIKVTVGFLPRFLIITAMEPTLQGNIINYTALVGTNNFQYMVEMAEDGFTVFKRTQNPGTQPTYPRLNEEDKRYNYIAFR